MQQEAEGRGLIGLDKRGRHIFVMPAFPFLLIALFSTV
jgi:hypothetical protein